MSITTNVYDEQAGSPFIVEAGGASNYSSKDSKLDALKEWKDENSEFLKEKLLVHGAVWAEVLKLGPKKIWVNDNFFELGWHSLLATQVVSKIRSHLEIDVPLKALFNSSTVVGILEVAQAIKIQFEKPSLDVDLTDVDFEETSL